MRALEEKGIGRPSTYAPTITTIIARGYVAREKKRLYPTELGRMVTDLMEQYFAPSWTPSSPPRWRTSWTRWRRASWTGSRCSGTSIRPLRRCWSVAEEQIEKVEIADEVSDVPCDQCGAMMVYKMGRFGRFLACPNFPECRNTKPILNYIDAPCPKCGGRLLEKVSRKNRKFYGCERYPGVRFRLLGDAGGGQVPQVRQLHD